jgi:hypothetical protein
MVLQYIFSFFSCELGAELGAEQLSLFSKTALWLGNRRRNSTQQEKNSPKTFVMCTKAW